MTETARMIHQSNAQMLQILAKDRELMNKCNTVKTAKPYHNPIHYNAQKELR